MSVPLDLSLISQLLTEQQTHGDLNALTKPGFFFVIGPTNTPTNVPNSCHVINLSVYFDNVYDDHHLRIFQIYINDNRGDNTVWYRQYFEVWTAWERCVTATDLSNSMSTKVNNSDLVADYYNKTDVDALINTINTQLDTKAGYYKILAEDATVKIYDNNGTAHSETTTNDGVSILVGKLNRDLIGRTNLNCTLQDDYPVNAKLTKIAISTVALDQGLTLPATITIIADFGKKIVATLDTDNSDTEFFIYNVPTNLQTETIGKGAELDVYFLN